MDIFIVSAVAFLVAILTFFSGFGLGTILTPVFMLYFPADLAIALTGVVHFFNNVFKFLLVKKNIDFGIFLVFGVPAICASIPGSFLLLYVSEMDPLLTYSVFEKSFSVVPVKLIIGILLIFFALFDLLPALKSIHFGKDKLIIGGILSGFFGGLSGNQGALRSAFLVKAGLSKEVFVATTIAISTCVDITRLGAYSVRFLDSGMIDNSLFVLSVTISAICGSFIGNSLLKKVTLNTIQMLVGILLILLSSGLALGVF